MLLILDAACLFVLAPSTRVLILVYTLSVSVSVFVLVFTLSILLIPPVTLLWALDLTFRRGSSMIQGPSASPLTFCGTWTMDYLGVGDC